MYKKRKDNDLSFGDFLKMEKLPIDKNRYTDNKTDEIIVDRIIKYENLNKELGEVFAGLNIPFNGLNVFAKSNYNKEKRDYKEYYNCNQKDFINEKFNFEIEKFNYNF